MWGKRDHIRDLSHNQRKIGDYYIEELEHLNLKLQQQEGNKKERLGKK
jgi:hypothetical protein